MSITRQVSRRALILQPSDAEVSTNQVYAARYEWRVDGELSIPSPTVIDSLKHTDAAFSIYRVDVSVNIGGTSQYQVLIKSYDTAGLNPVTHVDEYITLTGNKNRISVAVLNAAVDQNRSLELTILEFSPAVAASDMTVTLIAEDFASQSPERQGHRIINSADTVMAQRADLKFRDMDAFDDGGGNKTVIRYPDGLNVSAADIDWSRGYVFYKNAAASLTLTFSNTVEGRIISFVILNTSGSPITLTLPAGIYRDPGIDLVVPAGKANVYTFFQANSNIFCSYLTGLSNV